MGRAFLKSFPFVISSEARNLRLDRMRFLVVKNHLPEINTFANLAKAHSREVFAPRTERNTDIHVEFPIGLSVFSSVSGEENFGEGIESEIII